LLGGFSHLGQRDFHRTPVDDRAQHGVVEPLRLPLELMASARMGIGAAVLVSAFADQAEFEVQVLARLAHTPTQEAAPVPGVEHPGALAFQALPGHGHAEQAFGRSHQARRLARVRFVLAEQRQFLGQAPGLVTQLRRAGGVVFEVDATNVSDKVIEAFDGELGTLDLQALNESYSK
jgi:hypothetical protein